MEVPFMADTKTQEMTLHEIHRPKCLELSGLPFLDTVVIFYFGFPRELWLRQKLSHDCLWEEPSVLEDTPSFLTNGIG